MQNLRPHPEPAESESACPQDFLGDSWAGSSLRSTAANHKSSIQTVSKAVHLQRQNLLGSQLHTADSRWCGAFKIGLEYFFFPKKYTHSIKRKIQTAHSGSQWKCRPSYPNSSHPQSHSSPPFNHFQKLFASFPHRVLQLTLYAAVPGGELDSLGRNPL